MKSKALFISLTALLLFAVVVIGLILHSGYKANKVEPDMDISTAPPLTAKIEEPRLPPPQIPVVPKAKVAIIIDDMGRNMKQLSDLLEIDAPLTVAVLPFLPYSRDVAEKANSSGRDVLLHLPMEPKDLMSNNPGKGALLTNMTEAQVAAQIREDIDAVPHIVGINNHMGSKFTENERLMKIVLGTIKEENLFFVDSKTTSRSAVHRLAKELGVKTATRHVFLDNKKDDITYIKVQLAKLITIAKKRGKAIGIGHPHPATIAAIKEMLPHISKDVEVVAVSSLIDSTNE